MLPELIAKLFDSSLAKGKFLSEIFAFNSIVFVSDSFGRKNSFPVMVT